MTAPDSLAEPFRDTLIADIGLTFVLAILVGAVPAALVVGFESVHLWAVPTFYLAYYLHLPFSAYHGRFQGWRVLTWLALTIALVICQYIEFARYLLPWGQVSYWLAGQVASLPVVGPTLETWFGAMPPRSEQAVILAAWLLLLALLVADVLAMHWPRMRRRLGALVAVFVAAIAINLLVIALMGWLEPATVAAPPGPDQLPDILPAWYALPYYAMLMTVPDKLAALVIVAVALALPLTCLWSHAEAIRGSRWGWTWGLCCLGFIAVFVALGREGLTAPEERSTIMARGLTIYFFLFFIAIPPMLNMLLSARVRPDGAKIRSGPGDRS